MARSFFASGKDAFLQGAAEVADKEQQNIGHIVGHTDAHPQVGVLAHLAEHVGVHVVGAHPRGHGGGDGAGTHYITTDTLTGEPEGGVFGYPYDSGLGGYVGGAAAAATEATLTMDPDPVLTISATAS